MTRKKLHSDLIYTGLNQFWRLISGPLSLILIPLYLTAEEQGYWFTIISIAAMATLADLGFSVIILQFSAHEFAFLRFNLQGYFVGDKKHLTRLANLYTFSLKWASTASLCAFPLILAVGAFLLSKKGTNVIWIAPWLIYGISSALVFINSTILCFFEGCNSVGKVQSIRLKISIVSSVTIFIGLYLKFSLYSLAISMFINFIVGFYLIIRNFKSSVIQLVRLETKEKYSWRLEFFSLFWKYAISWASGYFMFQMFTPISFHYFGAVEAGKVGISISLWMAVFGLSNVWVSAITPKMNMYVSKKMWIDLDKHFFRSLFFASTTFFSGAICIFISYSFLQTKGFIVNRFVSELSMIFLGVGWFLQLLINTLAVYLRAHKEELFVTLSFISAIYIAVTTILCAKYLTPNYLFLGYFSSYLLTFPWTLVIFYRRKRLHQTNNI